MPGRATQEVVLHGLIATLTVQWIDLVRDLALNKWGYQGEWRLGIHCTKLVGKHANTNSLRGADVPFKAMDYTKVAVSSLVGQEAMPWQTSCWQGYTADSVMRDGQPSRYSRSPEAQREITPGECTVVQPVCRRNHPLLDMIARYR